MPSTPSSAPSEPTADAPVDGPRGRRRFGLGAIVLIGLVVLAVIAVVAMLQADDGDTEGSRPVTDVEPGQESVAGVAEAGSQAPDFDLARLRGEGRVSLAEYRGTPVILNFWASWCIPCRKEFPLFGEARADYRPDQLGIVGITYRDLPDDARRFAREHDATWTLAEGGQGDPVAKEYGVRAMPQTFFVDRDGTIVSRYYGAPSRDRFEAEVARIAGEPAATTPPSGTAG